VCPDARASTVRTLGAVESRFNPHTIGGVGRECC
jgi:hypothetical protein